MKILSSKYLIIFLSSFFASLKKYLFMCVCDQTLFVWSCDHIRISPKTLTHVKLHTRTHYFFFFLKIQLITKSQ